MKKIKLSEHQEKVIRLMQKGWELGSCMLSSRRTYCFLQKRGLGKGGPAEDTEIQTVKALVKNGLIEENAKLYLYLVTTKYVLTEVGKVYVVGEKT
jgi:hypothetical protein